ncbi:putative NBD/HSP70 family sugar kinase [Diaminobutyricimonas aerilata]|uniref:Putative NBD/HSP70 family sugar kinase n=1 Tax=Diaminobutyricimonas aerilata TaxID=1162967 RepID=A0A2M9CN84_9MICO|nr:ROK family transcriptional regulator [Diaminobutyricimonas aerilata]PJJ73350.1 putative NBD/HSP70 family sugar kinase [Diaminobutyricimonas aerilata]
MTTTAAQGRPGSRLRLKTPASIDIFTRILTHGPIGRIDVGRQTGLSQAAVTKAVAPLVAEGFIQVAGELPAGLSPGRPVYPLTVVPDALLVLGIKVNVDEVIGVATGMTADIRHTVHLPLADTALESVLDAVEEVAGRLTAALGDDVDRLVGIGVSVSGDVDTDGGVVRDSPLLGWSGVPLARLLTERLGRPVMIDNDVRALTIAEHWFGVGVDSRSFAIVTIGRGIGCGLFLNGDVVAGSHGVAGEIGHLPLASMDAVCVCGRHGCVEAVASSSAILRAVRAASGNDALEFADAAELARAGDRAAVAAFDRAGTAIGAALAVVANLTGPDTVLVAGEGMRDFELYESRIRDVFTAHAFGAAVDCTIITREHTFDDWARGAAASVIRATVRQTFPT